MTKPYLEILNIKGRASIQDLGRLKAQHLGFSASGAADEFAFLFANKLIAQHYNTSKAKIAKALTHSKQQWPAIEITLGQMSFKAYAQCTIAITGADCAAKINNIQVKNWQIHTLEANDIIEFSMPKSGLISYLAVYRGFTCQPNQKPWLESYAQTQNELALGFSGEPLTCDSKLYFSAQTQTPLNITKASCHRSTSPLLRAPAIFYAKEKITLRMMPSRLFLQMSNAQQQQFLSTEYIINTNSNRMGYRLATKPLLSEPTAAKILPDNLRAQHLLSMPVTYGMVQFPENEQAIILMKERQTMGGYPVLGTVMQTDLFRLSQMRPGEKVCFSVVSPSQARQQLAAFYQKFISP